MEQTNHWKDALERLLESSADGHGWGIFEEISRLGAEMGDEAGEALLRAHPELFEHAPALTDKFHEAVVGRETAEAQRVMRLELNGPVSYRDVANEKSRQYYDRLDELHEHIDFRDCRRVVMVGCGWRPFTIFHIHDRTSVPEIIGLDVHPDALETARGIAAKLGYPRVRFELHDGRSYDYREAQIVYLSRMVSPKAAILSRIAETAPENVQIIAWEPFSLGRLWSESIEFSLDPRITISGQGSRSVTTLSRDLYLKRRAVPPAAGEA